MRKISDTGEVNVRSLGDAVEIYVYSEGREAFAMTLSEAAAIDMAARIMGAAVRRDVAPRVPSDEGGGA